MYIKDAIGHYRNKIDANYKSMSKLEAMKEKVDKLTQYKITPNYIFDTHISYEYDEDYKTYSPKDAVDIINHMLTIFDTPANAKFTFAGDKESYESPTFGKLILEDINTSNSKITFTCELNDFKHKVNFSVTMTTIHPVMVFSDIVKDNKGNVIEDRGYKLADHTNIPCQPYAGRRIEYYGYEMLDLLGINYERK